MTGPILSTHTGSLPPDFPGQARLQELLTDRVTGQPVDSKEFADLADEAVDEAVGRQRRIGIDIVSNGEMDRGGFIDTARLTNFSGPETTVFTPRDLEVARMLEWFLTSSGVVMPRMNNGPVRHNPEPLAAELERYLRALGRHGIDTSRAFLPEPSPGVVVTQGSTYYEGGADDERFLADVTAALHAEYHEVAKTGLIVQVDAPDLPMDWYVWHAGQGMDEFLGRLRRRVQAINDATDGIPAEQVRVHVCHGNWQGPHNFDITLPEIIDTLYQLRAGTLVIELANRRHHWERRIFGEPEYKLPERFKLGGGVIDSTSTSIEHPETVADEILEIAGLVGPDRFLAATDCGFRTMLGLGAYPYITEQKLTALVEGTRLANERVAKTASVA